MTLGVSTAPAGANYGTRRTRGKNLGLLTASTSMDNAEANLTTVMFPLMRDAFGLSSAALGIIVAVSKAVGIVTALPWALLSRRYPRRVVLAICSGFWGIWVILAGLSQSFGQFLVLYGIAAAGFAGAGAIALEILGDMYDDAHRGRGTGVLYAGVAVVTGASSPLFGLLSFLDEGWRYAYIISGAACLVIGVLTLTLLDDPRRSHRHGAPDLQHLEAKARRIRDGIRELAGISTYRGILLQRVFSAQGVLMSFGVVFLVEERGYSTASASVVALPFALGYVAGTLVGGRLIDRIHCARPASGRIIMLQASQLAFAAVAAIALAPAWGSLPPYLALFFLLGVLQGQVPVVNRPLIMAVVPAHLRSIAFAVSVSTVDALAYAGYALLVGFLGASIGLGASLIFVVVGLTSANGVFSWLLYRPYARDTEVRA